MPLVIPSTEVPSEVYNKLLDAFSIKNGASMLGWIFDFHSNNIDDAKMVLLLKYNCLLRLGLAIHINIDSGSYADPNSLDSAIKKGKVYIGDIDGFSLGHVYDSGAIMSALTKLFTCGPIYKKLCDMIEHIKIARDFNCDDATFKMDFHVSVCRLCNSVLIGSSRNIFVHHMNNDHSSIRSLDGCRQFGYGNALSDYIYDNKCIKCGGIYEIFSDHVEEDPKIRKYLQKVFGMSLDPLRKTFLDGYHQLTRQDRYPHRTHKWRNKGSVYKDAIISHIFECFDIEYVSKNIYPGLQEDAIILANDYSDGSTSESESDCSLSSSDSSDIVQRPRRDRPDVSDTSTSEPESESESESDSSSS